MKLSVIVNNYNYAQYVLGALDGVLKQSLLPDEIIVIDDCSTDESVRKLQDYCSKNSNIRLVIKPNNGGQLSCFNEGYKLTSGDIVFFLDSDDLYKRDYLREAMNYYMENPDCDVLFCDQELFGKEAGIINLAPGRNNLGLSVLKTYCCRWQLGPATSCISMRRPVLEKIMPMPYENDWRICADDALIDAASIVGARMHHLGLPLVKYRIHEKNNYYGNKTEGKIRKRVSWNAGLLHRNILSKVIKSSGFSSNIIEEIRSIKKFSLFGYPRFYFVISKVDLPLVLKIRLHLRILYLSVKTIVNSAYNRVCRKTW